MDFHVSPFPGADGHGLGLGPGVAALGFGDQAIPTRREGHPKTALGVGRKSGDFPEVIFRKDADGRRVRLVLTGGVVHPDGTRAGRADEDAARDAAVRSARRVQPDRTSRRRQEEQAKRQA